MKHLLLYWNILQLSFIEVRIRSSLVSIRHSQTEADSRVWCSRLSVIITVTHSMNGIVIMHLFQSQKTRTRDPSHLIFSEAIPLQYIGINWSILTILQNDLFHHHSRQIHTYYSFPFEITSLQCITNGESQSIHKSLSNWSPLMLLLFQAIWTVTRVYILLSAARKDSPRILPVMPKPHSVPIS